MATQPPAAGPPTPPEGAPRGWNLSRILAATGRSPRAAADVDLRIDLGQQLALRGRGIDTRVGMVVSGPTVNPRVRLYSEPALSDFDTLTWLVLGRGPEGLGRDDSALLQRAALSLLAGERSGDSFVSKLGLDSLSVLSIRARTGDENSLQAIWTWRWD